MTEAREEAVELARECVELGVALTPQTLALVLAELDQARADLAHARSAGRAYRDERDRLRELVDLAAELKTVGGIRPGYQERGEWVRGTLPPPASATDGPAVVTNPERSEHA